jgi:hypothetical protein
MELYSSEELERLKLFDLKQICKDKRYKGYSKLNKSEMIKYIIQNQMETIQIAPSSKTTETFGMSCEVALCEMFNIPHSISESRISKNDVNQIRNLFEKEDLGFRLSKHIGKQNKVDFVTTNNETVSVKTNTSGYKVCPQVIGQTTKKKFCEFFHMEDLSTDEIKEFIYENIDKLIVKYFEHLFCCDILIWIGKGQKMKIFRQKEMLEKYGNIKDLDFTWTRTLNRWNESNTLKANGKTIAEFQIHTHRNSIKMRFDLKFFIDEISSISYNKKKIMKKDPIPYDRLVACDIIE